MSLRRMAVKPLLLSTLWATTCISTAAATAATSFTLSSNITSFIPSCALGCFQSFLEANFSPTTCGTSPSLQCLCSHVGSSGFTVGEGALACIVVENNVGVCQDVDATSQVIAGAYAMCAGQKSAAPETHPTIIATLVVPTGDISAAAVPTQTPTTMSTTTSSRASSTPSSTPSSAPAAAQPGPSATTTTSAQPVTSQPTPDSQQGLTGAQVAGISVGAAAAVIAVVGVLLLLVRRSRQRILAGSDPGFTKMRDSHSLGRRSFGSSRMLQISAPMNLEPHELDIARALDPRTNVRPETIGIALSPNRPVAVTLGAIPQARPQISSPAAQPPPVPPKPALTVAIPQVEPPLLSPRMPFSGRDSVVTEFAEDGDEADVSAGGAQIWRPPVSDPASATAYYVADRWGNWTLGDNRRSEIAELEGSSPLSKTETEQYSMAQATRAAALPSANSSVPARPSPAKLGPPIQFRQQQEQQASLSRASSVYSDQPPIPRSLVPGATGLMPQPLRLAQPPYQNVARQNSIKRTASRRPGPGDRSDSQVSERSATTIASSTTEGGGDVVDPDQPSLSPVVESPQSIRISPRTGPGGGRITGQQQDMLSLFPAPARGNTYRPPGQPSPPLGTVRPPQGMKYGLPGKQVKSPKPAPNRNPAQILTGSPNLSQLQGSPQSSIGRRPSPKLAQQQEEEQQQQQEQEYQQPRPGIARTAKTPPSPSSFNSAASSLLAKRLGAERAAALTLDGREQQRPRPGGGAGKWKLQPGGQPGPNGTPPPPGAPGMFVEGVGHVPLPATPGWQPKLTPTRRGDDLFLSVQ